MSRRHRAGHGGEDEASAEAVVMAEGVETRDEGGKTVYSAKGVDLLARDKDNPARYTLLVDHEPTGSKAGQVKAFTDGSDEACATTVKELAATLPD